MKRRLMHLIRLVAKYAHECGKCEQLDHDCPDVGWGGPACYECQTPQKRAKALKEIKEIIAYNLKDKD